MKGSKGFFLITAFLFVFVLGGTLIHGGEVMAAELYQGYSQADENGYVKAEVSLENGEIVGVNLTEYDEMAREKGDDYDWKEWHEAMEELPQRFVEAGDSEVEVISGATSTSEKAIEAVEMALDRSDGEEYFSGTFMGISSMVERGWGVAWVTVEVDEEAPEGYRIDDLRLEEVSGDQFKDEDYGWEEFHAAQQEIADRMKEADTYEVETYTGATGSSELWQEAVEEALEKAGF